MNPIAIIVGILLLVGAWVGLQWMQPAQMRDPQTYATQETLDPQTYASLGGEFELLGANGKQVSLKDFENKLVLLTFGYTSCPDACPITMAYLQQVAQKLGKDLEQVQVVFVSFDPERDSPEQTQAYAEYFNASFIGVTGSKEQLNAMAKKYGTFYLKEELDDSDAGYVFAHTDHIYLMDQQGRIRSLYNTTKPLDSLIQDIQSLIL